MRRLAVPLSMLALLVLAAKFLVGESAADLENGVFTSRPDRIRMVVPRGWRATDQPSYPGLVLWMVRSQPPGQIVLTSEAFTRDLYCSWPIECRSSHESAANKYACALRQKLAAARLKVGPIQPGPKDNEDAGLPSVWFEYDDGKTFVRQAIALGTADRAVSLVLSTPTNEARASHVRAFEQALRTLRPITVEEAAATSPIDAAPAPLTDAGASPNPDALQDASNLDAGVTFESAPAPREAPIGPCPTGN